MIKTEQSKFMHLKNCLSMERKKEMTFITIVLHGNTLIVTLEKKSQVKRLIELIG